MDPNSAKCSGSGSETLVLMMMEYKICKNRKFGSDNPFVDLKPVELHKLISIYMSKLFKKRSYKTFMLYFIRSYSGKRVRPGHLLIHIHIYRKKFMKQNWSDIDRRVPARVKYSTSQFKNITIPLSSNS